MLGRDEHGNIAEYPFRIATTAVADILRETKTRHGDADPTVFALEMPAAWFAARGIGPRAKVRRVNPTRPYDGSERLEPGGWTARFPLVGESDSLKSLRTRN